MAESTGSKLTVLLAIDDSEHAVEALNFYLTFLHRKEHDLVLTHSIEIPYQAVQPLRQELVDRLLDDCKANAKEVESKFERLLKDKGVEFRQVSEFGCAGEFLVKTAKQENAGLIVMGCRGLGKIRRTILGSVSDYVLHHVHCPVVVHKHNK